LVAKVTLPPRASPGVYRLVAWLRPIDTFPTGGYLSIVSSAAPNNGAYGGMAMIQDWSRFAVQAEAVTVDTEVLTITLRSSGYASDYCFDADDVCLVRID
jgi:hypothetical protein